MRRHEQIAAVLAAVAVVTVYVFFGSVGRMNFHRVHWFEKHSDSLGAEYYVLEAEGFRRGHLDMAATPDARMSELHDPWDFGARQDAGIDYLWDASWFRGKYYLYFTPLPVLLFYLPYRMLGQMYPNDALAATFFCTWAFAMAVAFLWRSLSIRKRFVPLWIWIAFAGLANVIPFSLPDVRVYEVAVLTGMAMSATWGFALLLFVEKPTVRRAAWVGVWLALAIAARPNLIVLLVPTAFAFWRHRSVRVAAAVGVPLAVVACSLVAFNEARFGHALESGISYQLTSMELRGVTLCRLCGFDDFIRFLENALEYQFWTPGIGVQFPFVDALGSRLDRSITFAGIDPEQVVGVAVVAPLVMIGTAFAALLALARTRDDPPSAAPAAIFGGAWLILLSIATCLWIVARYSLDFMMLMGMATPVAIETGLGLLERWRVRTMPLRVLFVVLVIYTVIFSIFLGLLGRSDSFRRFNPKMYARIAAMLHVKAR